MALKKSITLDNGVTAEYWRLINFTWDAGQSEQVTLALYVDKATRDAGSSPVDVEKYSWDAASPDGYLGADGYQQTEIDSIVQYYYDQIKTNVDWFSDSEDA